MFFFSTKLPWYAVKIGWFITNLFSEQNNPLLVVNTTFSDGGYIYMLPPYIYVYIYIYIHIPRDLQFDLIFTPVLDQFPLRDPFRNGWRKRSVASPWQSPHHPASLEPVRPTVKKSQFHDIDLHIYIYVYVYMYILYMYIYIGIFYMRIYNYDNIVGDTG